MSDRRKVAVIYLVAQAAAVFGWWVALLTSPTVRGWFELDTGRRDVLSAFVVADLVVLLAGSTVAAAGLLRSARWASRAVAGVAGGSAYATLWLAGWVALGGRGAVGLVPMLVATAATTALAVWVARDSP